MLRIPRSSPVSGRSSQVVMLAIAGLGTALFLFFLFPRMTASRAAAKRVEIPTEPAALVEEEAPKPPPRPVELLNPMGFEAGAATAKGGAQAAALLAPAASAASEAPATGAEGEALLAASTKPALEGPRLTYAKREGKTEVLAPGELRVRNKEKAKERLEKATEKALAEGKPVPENLRANAKAAGGEKATRPNGKGKKGKAKPKEG